MNGTPRRFVVYWSMKAKRVLGWVFVSLAIGLAAGAEEPGYEPARFFRLHVEPILKTRCYKCHSSDSEAEGGLSLDSKAGWVNGGEHGPAVKPNDLTNSPLIQAVRYHHSDTAMPPKKKLSPYEIAMLETWVLLGAPDPRDQK